MIIKKNILKKCTLSCANTHHEVTNLERGCSEIPKLEYLEEAWIFYRILICISDVTLWEITLLYYIIIL